MEQIKCEIAISTKDRCEDLLLTLSKIRPLLNLNVSVVVFDDGSTDGTSERVKTQFPEVKLLQNTVSKGYIYCRNRMLNESEAHFVISLDDDAHFLTPNPIEIIKRYFAENPSCGVIAARIFWDKSETGFQASKDQRQIVKSYVGCGHVWRMTAWRDIPNYPEWFEFYGEENFASFQLFKTNWEIHYLPEILVHHRVDLKQRAQNRSAFAFRYRRAIRADWYNYFLFFPWSKIPRLLAYSLWMQGKTKIFKGNFKVVLPLFLAVADLVLAMPKLIKHRNALSPKEYEAFAKLKDPKIYWKPEN